MIAALLIVGTLFFLVFRARHHRPLAAAPSAVAPSAIAPEAPHQDLFRSSEGRFQVEFPPDMVPAISTGIEGKQTVHRAEAKREAVYFTVDYTDSEASVPAPDREGDLDRARDGTVRTLKGTIDEEVHLSIEAFPGRQLRARGDSPFGPIVYRSRTYVVGTRFYGVIVTYPVRAPEPEDRVNSFLSSFRLLHDGHAGPPAGMQK